MLTSMLMAFVCVALPLAAQSISRPKIEGIELSGTVVDGVTGAPIADAVVAGPEHIVKTDSSGRFVIADFVAGEVSTYKSGYFQPEDIGKCCSRHDVLFGEKQPAGLDFILMPKGKMAGKVSLASGAPIASMPLTLLRQEASEDGLLVWTISGRAQTAADGSYGISNLMPGAYRLRSDDLVTDRTADNLLLTAAATDQIDGLARSYFQGGSQGDQDGPHAISMHAGDDKTVDMSIKPVPFYRVAVHMGGPPITGSFGWTLRREDGTRVALPQASISAKSELRFFVPPGSYELEYTLWPKTDPNTGQITAWGDGSTAPRQGLAAFEVRDQPIAVNGSDAEAPRALTMHVAQHFAHRIQHGFRETVTVRDQEANSYDTTFDPNLEDQSIKLRPLGPGKYHIALSGGSEYYIASLKCGVVDLLRGPLEIGADRPECSIEAVLRDDFGRLNVELDPAGTESVRLRPGEHVAVQPGLFAVASDGHLDRVNSYCASSAHDGTTSTCSLPPLPPGQYLVSAFPLDRTTLGSAFNEAATGEQLKKRGVWVEVKPGETATVQLKGSLTPWR